MPVRVKGPDGQTYSFPDGTDKSAAIRYFKNKGITGAPADGAAKAATPPGAVSRFLRSAADASGLSAVGHAIANPGETATNIAKTVADPYGQDSLITKAVVPTMQNTVDNARQAWQDARAGNTSGAISHAVSAVPVVGPALDKATDQYADKDYAGEAGTLTGTAAALAAPKVIKEAVPVAARFARAATAGAPEAADSAAAGIINRTIGARKGDFARGANPGRGYIKSDIGPSASMESIADKASAVKNDVTGQLQDAYSKATASGKKIPAADVRKAINSVIDDAKNSAGGPGVMADPEAYEELRKTFDASLDSADKGGGFTPNELWEIRKNIGRNLNWGDQSKLNMTKVQQRVSGSLGGLLKDAVPETVDLNQQYGDLDNLTERAETRAITHSSPLTSIGTKILTTGGGALLGHGTPLGSVGGAVALGALDTIPVKTAVASGLSAAGGAIEPAIDAAEGAATAGAPAAVLPAALGPVPTQDQPKEPDRSTDNQSGKGTNEKIGDQLTSPTASIPPAPNPDSHIFSPAQWLQKYPGGDVEAAKKVAMDAGYELEPENKEENS